MSAVQDPAVGPTGASLTTAGVLGMVSSGESSAETPAAGTKHNHELLPFGRKMPKGQCPRCDELHAGAPARTWGGRLIRRCGICGGPVEAGYLNATCEACQRRRHDCERSGCGPVCTAFQW
jgi:hypothetical protein